VTGVAKGSLSMMNALVVKKPIPPAAYLSHLNRIIYSACEGRLLITMAVVQLDLVTGKAIVANAGHEFPFLFRGSQADPQRPSRAVEEILIRGERLGFSPYAKYSSTTVDLTPGDAILLFTDGLSEGMNPEGAPWGARQLRKAFAEGAVQQSDA